MISVEDLNSVLSEVRIDDKLSVSQAGCVHFSTTSCMYIGRRFDSEYTNFSKPIVLYFASLNCVIFKALSRGSNKLAI